MSRGCLQEKYSYKVKESMRVFFSCKFKVLMLEFFLDIKIYLWCSTYNNPGNLSSSTLPGDTSIVINLNFIVSVHISLATFVSFIVSQAAAELCGDTAPF